MNQQQNMQNQKPIMKQPPQLVTVKDSLYITDMLSWNLLAMKKAHFYSNHCQDPEIKQALIKAGTMHQQHYVKILSHLQKVAGQNPTVM